MPLLQALTLVTGDAQWSTWSGWVDTVYYVNESSNIQPNLTVALCKKTNRTRERQCDMSGKLGSGAYCKGQSTLFC